MPVEMARWWLMVGALAALAGGARAYCPPTPHCTCSDLNGWNYECEEKLGDNNGAQLFVRAIPYSRVEVTCQRETKPCGLLPRVDLASGGKLPHVSTKGCSPALLPCLLAAVNASDVATLTLLNPRDELRPEHLAGAHPEVLLFYQATTMTRIPSEALEALPGLRQLRINEARVRALKAGALPAAPALTFLELAGGGLATLEPAAFRGLTHLTQLMLWKNRIVTLDRDTFQGLESLEQMSLYGNQLRALPPGLLDPMPSLRELTLQENQLERLGPGLFNGTQLQKVKFQQYDKANLTLEDLTFANMSALTKLSLPYCGLASLPARLLLGSVKLEALDLSHNLLGALPPALFAGLGKLAALNISHNRLAALPAELFLPLKGLVELNLNKNHIQVLPDYIFSGPKELRKLSMDDNEIHTIAAQAFMGAGSLHSVSLANNRISLRRDEDYGNLGQMSPFQYLLNARELLLRGNQLSHVFQDWTDLLTQLTSLDLSNNSYTELWSDQLQFLSDKNVVDLRNNSITTITFMYPPVGEGEGEARRSTLLLDGNPLRCDCSAYPLTLMQRGARLYHAFPRIDLGRAACASPPDKKGRRVARLLPDELTCDLPRADCPARCRSCLSRPATDALELTCDHLPIKLPNSTEFSFSRFKLKLDDITGLGQLPAAVYSLDVSGIGLEELKLMRQPHLQELDLRNNRLKTVPQYILDSNLTLYLSNNSLECECEYTEYIRTLQTRRNVNDTADIKCSGGSGRRLAEVEADGLCAARDAALLFGALFLALALAAIALAVLVYYYNYEILVYLTSRGYLKWLFTEEILDADKLYDVFVAYSHADVAFVQDELMPRLEAEFGLRVCVHYRDWVVGDMIPTQVVRSVEQSRKTLVVLSRQFAASAWAGMEFRTAHCMALKEGRPRVVLVILDDDVIHDEKLDKDIRAYLDTNTYLQRHDGRFWERLRRAVAPRDRRFTFLGKFRGGGAARGAAAKGGGGGGALDAQLNSDGQLVNAAQAKDAV